MVHGKDGKPIGNLFVDQRASGNRNHNNTDITPFYNPPVEILPLLKYCMTLPKLVVKRGINDCAVSCFKEMDCCWWTHSAV
jgi:hypothetical protein